MSKKKIHPYLDEYEEELEKLKKLEKQKNADLWAILSSGFLMGMLSEKTMIEEISKKYGVKEDLLSLLTNEWKKKEK